MRTNDMVVTGKHILVVGVGSFLGIFAWEVIKTLMLGMTFANSWSNCLTTATGRTACILAVLTLFYFVTNKEQFEE